MAKLLLYICCLLSTVRLNAADAFTFKHTDNSYKECISIGKVFSEDVRLSPFLNSKQIIGLAISGSLIKNSIDYYARIVLCDRNGNDYLVLELYDEINSEEMLFFSNYCEETMILDNIEPASIKIMLRDAELRIDSITYLLPKGKYTLKGDTYQKEWTSCKRIQVEQIVKKINSYNFVNGKMWGAGVTELSMLPWRKKNKCLGITDDNIDARGYEYYTRGIFEYGRIQSISLRNKKRQRSRESSFIYSFDWRNRHGRSWLTPVRDQYPHNGCWAFASVGVTEAIAQLYFNRDLPFSVLSVQEVISCSNCGSNADGGYTSDAFQWIADNGISEEEAFPFVNNDVPCTNKRSEYEEQISFYNAMEVPIGQNKEDSVKKYLIQKGPMISGFPGHAMCLVGFGTIQAGDTIEIFNGENYFYVVPEHDSRVGHTYWIYKDSYGMRISNEHNGYTYLYFPNLAYMSTPYYAETPVYSNILTNQDIVCKDADGDGYYYWGISDNRPSFCPEWVPDVKDGNDANFFQGRILLENTPVIGELESLTPDENNPLIISSDTTFLTRQGKYSHIRITSGGKLVIKNILNLFGRVTVTVNPGGELIIDGGVMTNAKIDLSSGGKITLINGGKLVMRTNTDFIIPTGALADVQDGEIIRSDCY